MKNPLVLGGAGFIGSNLVERLVALELRPIVFTRSGTSLDRLSHLLDKIDIVFGDWQDTSIFPKITKNVDTVYHLITTTFPSSVINSCVYDIRSNLVPTISLVEACLENNVKQIVYASSGGTIYGNPQFLPITETHPLVPSSLYGQSKLTIENFLSFYERVSPLSLKILRISNPFGSGQKVLGIQGLIAVSFGCALYNKTISIYGKGDNVRDYIYIDDVIDAMIAATDYPKSIIANISSGEGKSILDIIKIAEAVSGKTISKKYCPAREGDVSVNILSNKLAKELLNWEPTSDFYDSMEKTWQCL